MEVDKKFNNISIFNLSESWVNVEFDDPSSRNALSENMINELNNFLDQIKGNNKIRGISCS